MRIDIETAVKRLKRGKIITLGEEDTATLCYDMAEEFRYANIELATDLDILTRRINSEVGGYQIDVRYGSPDRHNPHKTLWKGEQVKYVEILHSPKRRVIWLGKMGSPDHRR